MLGAFHAEPIMRSLFLVIVLLVPAWPSAAPPGPAPAMVRSACIAAMPVPADEPPAWLLLAAAAVLLLGAGRLAAS